jgi:hypothetical protein
MNISSLDELRQYLLNEIDFPFFGGESEEESVSLVGLATEHIATMAKEQAIEKVNELVKKGELEADQAEEEIQETYLQIKSQLIAKSRESLPQTGGGQLLYDLLWSGAQRPLNLARDFWNAFKVEESEGEWKVSVIEGQLPVHGAINKKTSREIQAVKYNVRDTEYRRRYYNTTFIKTNPKLNLMKLSKFQYAYAEDVNKFMTYDGTAISLDTEQLQIIIKGGKATKQNVATKAQTKGFIVKGDDYCSILFAKRFKNWSESGFKKDSKIEKENQLKICYATQNYNFPPMFIPLLVQGLPEDPRGSGVKEMAEIVINAYLDPGSLPLYSQDRGLSGEREESSEFALRQAEKESVKRKKECLDLIKLAHNFNQVLPVTDPCKYLECEENPEAKGCEEFYLKQKEKKRLSYQQRIAAAEKEKREREEKIKSYRSSSKSMAPGDRLQKSVRMYSELEEKIITFLKDEYELDRKQAEQVWGQMFNINLDSVKYKNIVSIAPAAGTKKRKIQLGTLLKKDLKKEAEKILKLPSEVKPQFENIATKKDLLRFIREEMKKN